MIKQQQQQKQQQAQQEQSVAETSTKKTKKFGDHLKRHPQGTSTPSKKDTKKQGSFKF